MEIQQDNNSSTSIFKSPGRVMVMIIVMALIGLAGFFVGRKLSPHTQDDSASPIGKYILLIHNENLLQLEIQKTQNEEWIKIINEDHNSEGAQFSGNGWIFWPGKEGPITEVKTEFLGNGNVSGYFIFEAKTEDEAVKIAKTCPHLKQRGFLEMRKLN